MKLFSQKNIRDLIKRYGIRPSKKLGQNFLIDGIKIKEFIKAASLQPDDIVLEVGPGVGSLTQGIAEKSKRVIAVEKSLAMCKILKEMLASFKNVQIVNKDILKFPVPKFDYKIAANLPFYLTAPLIRKFLENENPPKEMILVVQKEVAQRICSSPPKMSILAVSVQFYAKPEIIFYISKNSFWPSPKVDCAVVKIIPDKTKFLPLVQSRECFFEIVKMGFSQPRKQLVNNFSKGLKTDKEKIRAWLIKNDVQPDRRAETLTIGEWIKLSKACGLLLAN